MKKKKIKIAALIVLSILFVFIAVGLINPLTVEEYEIESDEIENPVRVVLITDLHSTKYGKGQKKLVDAIDKQHPDAVLIAGDFFDDVKAHDNAETFLSAISGKFPCYYVSGNHEYRNGDLDFDERMEMLKKYGVVILSNECVEIELNGQKISLLGLEDPNSSRYGDGYAFTDAIKDVRKEAKDGQFSLLLSHRPEFFEEYAENGYDLVLCGHAHGGQWEIPLILENGLYTPGQGLFPDYTNGKFCKDGTTMIVSRGLARAVSAVPRFYNKPEIVVIEIK